MATPSETPVSKPKPQAVQIEAEAAQIEAEDDLPDTDSAFGDDSESYTTSLKSSITNYTYENGRRYHAFKDGSYYLPNDESELNRLDLVHHIISLRLDGDLHWAPIGDNPQRILDIGTGTGIWAIAMGDQYPNASILGNDLSPVQPALVPPNVRFEVDDAENEWVYGSQFDYIHCRYMAGALKDWPKLMAQAFKFTKPGGWVEFQDFDMTFYTTNGLFKRGSAMDRWSDYVKDALAKSGLVAEPGKYLEGWVKDAGFANVKSHVLPIPTGQWPKDKKLKEIGAFDLIQFLDGLEAITLRVMTNVQGWTAEETHVFLADVRKELKNTKTQAQHNFYVVYAQKPLDAE